MSLLSFLSPHDASHTAQYLSFEDRHLKCHWALVFAKGSKGESSLSFCPFCVLWNIFPGIFFLLSMTFSSSCLSRNCFLEASLIIVFQNLSTKESSKEVKMYFKCTLYPLPACPVMEHFYSLNVSVIRNVPVCLSSHKMMAFCVSASTGIIKCLNHPASPSGHSQ